MKITVFTPTYNRAYIIENLYRSLQRQTFQDFEWLIMDDGSADNTKELVEGWREEENDFLIRYYKKENGGKCRAINRALDFAEGELFFTVDSDDYLTDDALEKIVQWERSLPANERFCGVAGNLGLSAEYTPNTAFPTEYYEGTLLDRYKNVDGERAIAFYTKIHRLYKYPEFTGEKFITEAVTWNRMAKDGYKMRFYNDIIWIYEYKDDGLTKAGFKLFEKNPQGYGLWLREKSEFMNEGWRQKLMMYYSFTCDLRKSYDSKKIAECIGTRTTIIAFCRVLNSLSNKIKGRK